MEYNEKYFKHAENCQCDIDKIKATVESAVTQRSPHMLDKDGNRLFYVDSFGFRGQIPGECKECYEEMSKARAKAMAAYPNW